MDNYRHYNYREFTIVQDSDYPEDQINDFLDMLDETRKILIQNKFKKLLYGKFYIIDKVLKINDNTCGAEYIPTDDNLLFYSSQLSAINKNLEGVIFLLIHEFGHRYYYKFLTESQRNSWGNSFSREHIDVDDEAWKKYDEEFELSKFITVKERLDWWKLMSTKNNWGAIGFYPELIKKKFGIVSREKYSY